MTNTFTIRNAEPEDAESIAAIHIASWQATYRGSMPDSDLDALTVEQRLPMWKRILASASALIRVWVAIIDDEIVGFCSIGPSQSSEDNGDTLELYTIYLRPDRERRGIGTALRHAGREMESLGATSATLWVLEGNHRARHFYEASSWKRDGAEKLDQMLGQAVSEVRYSKRLITEES